MAILLRKTRIRAYIRGWYLLQRKAYIDAPFPCMPSRRVEQAFLDLLWWPDSKRGWRQLQQTPVSPPDHSGCIFAPLQREAMAIAGCTTTRRLLSCSPSKASRRDLCQLLAVASAVVVVVVVVVVAVAVAVVAVAASLPHRSVPP